MTEKITNDELGDILKYCEAASVNWSSGAWLDDVSMWNTGYEEQLHFGIPCPAVDDVIQAQNDCLCAVRSRTDLPRFAKALQAAYAEIDMIRQACFRTNNEVEQVLGKSLDYPWFKDDKENFPDATEEDGVCVGDHVAVSIADEAAARIETLKLRVAKLEAELTAEKNVDRSCPPADAWGMEGPSGGVR